MRDRSIRGRKRCRVDGVDKVVESLANSTYMIETADGHGNIREVERSEIKVCPPAVLQRPAIRTARHRITTTPPPPTNTSEEDVQDMEIEIIPPPPSYAD